MTRREQRLVRALMGESRVWVDELVFGFRSKIKRGTRKTDTGTGPKARPTSRKVNGRPAD
jgi:hypothetical protein